MKPLLPQRPQMLLPEPLTQEHPTHFKTENYTK